MLRFAMLLLAGGCPYVFQRPDLSNVENPDGVTSLDGGGDADTDADSDSDSDADTDGGSVAPTLTSLEVAPRLDGVVLHFSIADPENDLVGGSLKATDGTVEVTLGIPGDLDNWNPLGVSSATVGLGPWLDCDTPTVDQTWTVTATDFGQNVSDPREASLHITALGRLPEIGNQWPDDAHRVDDPPPFMGCVSYTYDDDEPGTMREQLFFDVEALFFVTPQSRDYRFALTWTPDADIDIFVLPDPFRDNNGDGEPDVAVSSVTYSMPEQAVLTAGAGDSWMFDPTFFDLVSGGLPPFEALFLIGPD